MFLKKGKKQPVRFFIIRLLQLLTGRTRICTFPRREHHTEVSPIYGTFLGLGIGIKNLKRRATINQRFGFCLRGEVTLAYGIFFIS
jgi:hypothetical protein